MPTKHHGQEVEAQIARLVIEAEQKHGLDPRDLIDQACITIDQEQDPAEAVQVTARFTLVTRSTDRHMDPEDLWLEIAHELKRMRPVVEDISSGEPLYPDVRVDSIEVHEHS